MTKPEAKEAIRDPVMAQAVAFVQGHAFDHFWNLDDEHAIAIVKGVVAIMTNSSGFPCNPAGVCFCGKHR